ncbi:helix-turn-helix domain-containing protein [Clostridium tagluense]|uniref:helix-turn-helix domain-containing protein n=1 Tax=Clostridium tagluense TaxID=360422 RepID=UPI001CF41CDA|nr:helix-turn-helix transcriptional regulator [Clostridium tagluense]MCB2300439.1 helix-turn-helix transcriptional regulator [Clostridium tagluense]
MNVKIGEYIKNLRLRKDMSTKELGRLSDINSSYVSRIERSDRNPSPATLKKLAPHLGTTYENLMQVAGFNEPNLTLLPTDKEGVTLALVKDLVSKKIIIDGNDIPEDIMKLIVDAVKLEVKLQCEAQEESKSK